MAKLTLIEKMTFRVNEITLKIQNWAIGIENRRREKWEKKQKKN